MSKVIVDAIRKTPEIRRLIDRFPTVVRSSRFPDMVNLIKGGRFDDAVLLAKKMEVSRQILQQNVVSRRMRKSRAAFLVFLKQTELDLKQIFQEAATTMESAVIRWASDRKNLRKLQERSQEMSVVLRRRIRVWLRRSIWDSGIYGLKTSEAALLPIFEKNWESLKEDRMAFAMDTTIANRNTPEVDWDSVKWTKKLDKIILDNEKAVVNGLNFTQRLYEITNAAKKEVDRLIANGILAGEHPTVVARRVKTYFSPKMIYDAAGNEILPKGAYYSPYKNALRMARTEMAKVYTQTTAAYMKDKWWIKGAMVTRTPEGEPCDLCDAEADGTVLSAKEFEDRVPVHPHCKCYPTYVFDDKIFADDDEVGPNED